MVNTVEGNDVNVDYNVSNAGFTLMTYGYYGRTIPGGSELRENYCSNCSNDRMVWLWGVYLESNPFTIQTGTGACTGNKGMHMKEVTQAALKDASTISVASWKSPRCLAETLEMQQGPLRCSMSRLAWRRLWKCNKDRCAALCP